jgi:2-oxo-3-hexenedioate decarboxylase/2-keto-4-pentenoate hydratase
VTDRVAEAAAAIAEARLAGRRLGVMPEAIRPRDEDEAYRVQAAMHGRLAAGGFGPRVGYKIACTTKVMQDYLGIPNPCSAGVFTAGVHRSGVALRHDDYRRVGIECEIAVRIGRDVPADRGPFAPGDLGDAVEAFMPAVEIVDDRYVDWRQTDTPTLIADDFFAAGCVLGDPVAARSVGDIAEMVGTTEINGIEAGRGFGRDVMGHPLNALAWLANSLGARGIGLKAGEIVLTGSLVETKWLNRGDSAIVRVSGLGSISIRTA